MKKNGFTLVEVITVIVILGIIILIAVPSYIGISENLRQKQYENKLKQIEIKATEWATDNNITDDTTITISRLVDDGYVNMDDETSNDKRVINPITKESMECYHVEITVDNGKYKAKVKESEDCELKDIEEQDKNIKVVGYEIDSSTNTILNSEELELQGNELPWSGKDILLLTTSDIYINPKSITYSSGSTNETKSGIMYSGSFQEGDTINVQEYQNLYIVSANVILKSKYNISYEMESEKPRKQILVKIDKENPNGSYRMLEKWGNKERKQVLLSGSDGVGSGVKGFYINSANTIENAEYIEADEKSEATITKDMGTYYYWIEDRVGNRNSESNILNVTNIDTTPPTCVYPEGNNTWTKNEVSITWGCSDTESGCVTENKTNVYNTSNFAGKSIESFTVFSEAGKTETVDGVVGEYIYDAAGNKTFCAARDISIKFDNAKPMCDPSKDHLNTPDGVTMHIRNCRDEGSGVKDDPSGDYSRQKSTRTFTVTDYVGNSQSYPIEVSHYQMYWRQDANSCNHTDFGCDRWPSCDVPTTWNSCKTGANTCRPGCSTGYKYRYIDRYGTQESGCSYSSESSALSACWGIRRPGGYNTVCDAYSCKGSCSNCYYGSNTCQGGWNTEYRADPYCGACQLGSWGTGGSQCGWHDVGWNRSSCSGNLCHVTDEQTWYT